MWTGEHRLTASVDPNAIWTRWVDTTYWPQDDPETKAAGYDAGSGPGPGGDPGTPAPGTTGWVRPAKGPMSHFTVIRADRAEGRFDLLTRFPGATMHFEHRMSPLGAPGGGARSGGSSAGDGAPAGGGNPATAAMDGGELGGDPMYELVHRIRISGPAAAVWGPLVGRSIVAGLPHVMTRIVERAAASTPQ